MKIKTIQTESLDKCINKEKHNIMLFDNHIHYIYKNYISIGEKGIPNPYPYKKYQVCDKCWHAGKYFLKVSFNSNKKFKDEITVTGANLFYDILLYIKHIGLCKIIRILLRIIGYIK